MKTRHLPEKSRSPGLADEHCAVALLLIDVINDFQFPGGDKLLESALRMLPKLERLLQRARAESVPVIYVNDNFGRWRSDVHALVRHGAGKQAIGRDWVKRLQPAVQALST